MRPVLKDLRSTELVYLNRSHFQNVIQEKSQSPAEPKKSISRTSYSSGLTFGTP